MTSGIRREAGLQVLRPVLQALASLSSPPARVATGWVSSGALLAGAQPDVWAPPAPRTDGRTLVLTALRAGRAAPVCHLPGAAPDLMGDPRLGERPP